MKLSLKFNTAVFIDAAVDNYQQLFDGVVAEAKPFLLNTATDGIEQIDQVLQEYPQVKTVHIISHGSPGCLYLGNSQLSLDTLEHYATQLQRWNIDNLLLYGCNVAAGDAGVEFVSKLQGLTGANIAASETLTGAAVKGGNWELEVTTGEMSSSLGLELEVMGSYAGVLNMEFQWAKGFGSSSDDRPLDAVADSSGNVWVTGFFYGDIDFNADGTNDLSLNDGDPNNTYLAKFDSNGNFVLAQNLGGKAWYHDAGIAIDSSDNVLVTGLFSGNIDINGDGSNDLTSNGHNDTYIAKFDSNGSLVFAENLGGSNDNQGNSLTTDSSGNVLVTGFFSGDIDIDSDGINDLTHNNGRDTYVAKFDSNGNFLWAKGFGSNSDDYGRGIATDSSGNVWVTGYYFGSNIDINGDGTNDLTNNGNRDGYVAKFDSNGDFLFAQNIGGISPDVSFDIATDSSGNAWVTGYLETSIDIDSDGINDLINNGDKDSYIAKFDNNGDLLFAQTIGDSANDRGYGIATDSDDNVWATGAFESSIDINSDGINDLISNGDRDSYAAKFDSTGNLLFAQAIGGSATEWGYGIATDGNGNAWATGTFESSIDINSDGTNELTPNSTQDGYIIKFSPLNSAPTALSLSNETIGENVADNSVVGTFSTTDPDVSDTFTYELVAGTVPNDNAAFTIDGDQLKINSSPDYEIQPTYNIRVKTTDAAGASYEQDLVINVEDANEVPTALSLSNDTIEENVADNSVVGTFSTTDPDVSDTFTYELVAGTVPNDNAAFTIDGDQLKINSSPDYEIQPTYNIRVKTTDAAGASYEQDLVINVEDIDENPAPTIIGTPERDVLIGEDPGEIIQGLADQDLIYGNGGEDIIEGGDGNDLVYGGKDNDILSGNNHNDRLYGNNGNDELFGNDGNDILYGGPGDDLLNGGAGSDRYYGNGGSDTFVLEAGMGKDSIYYFEDEVDLIQLEGGLNFADLVIESWSSSTLIKYGEETLATLYQVDAALITQDDFV